MAVIIVFDLFIEIIRKRRKVMISIIGLSLLFVLVISPRNREFPDLNTEVPLSEIGKPTAKVTDERLVGWEYDQLISLTPATPENDYQIKIELNPSTFDYSKSNTNGTDLRFTDFMTGNLFPYWIETWDPVGTSTIWVKVANAGTNVIHMHYGNSTAITESNGEATFLFFDDFPGTSINSSKWNIDLGAYSSLNISNSIVTLASDTPADYGSGVMLGFSDYYVKQGYGYGDVPANGTSMGLPWGASHKFATRRSINYPEFVNETATDYAIPEQ